MTGCSQIIGGDFSMPQLQNISSDEWKSIAQKRILFAHQSVGENILAGIRSLADESNTTIKITKSREVIAGPGITHFFVGKNEAPYVKLKDFEDTLNGGAITGADIALLKLCYIDINRNTDVVKLAEAYSSMLFKLSQRYPKTTFIAVTVPVRTVSTGFKVSIRRLLGKKMNDYEDNVRRQEFNTILRNRFGVQGRLFDLAKAEAQGTNTITYNGKPLDVLNTKMAIDSGHLNAFGERIVAAEFIKYITSLSANQ